MSIKLYASSFAGFIGKNPYVKQHEVFEKTWQKFSPDTYFAAVKRNHHVTDQECLQSLRHTIPEVEVALHSAESSTVTTSATLVAENQHALTEELTVDLTSHEKKLVCDEIRKQLFTRYGTAKERSVVSILEKEMGMAFAKGIEHVTYTKTYMTANGTPWTLAGKIDALTTDAKTILEVKNRVKRLFMHATDYERIQVECYLRMVGTAQNALLVEAFSVNGTTTLNIIPVDRDDVCWSEWHRTAEMYIDYLNRLVQTPGLQDSYFQSKRPTAFLRKVVDA